MTTKGNFAALTLALAGVGLVVALLPRPAVACCGDGAVAAAGAMSAGSAVSAAVAGSTGTIVQWLATINDTIGQGFGKLYSELNKQTAQQKVFEQGKITVQAQAQMERATAEAVLRYEPSPRVCFETAGGAAGGLASGEARQSLFDLNQDLLDRALYATNTQAFISGIYKDHTSKYCSAQDGSLGRCTPNPDPSLQNADVRADALLNRSSLSDPQLAAARALVANISNPVPTQTIPKAWEKTAQGQAFVAAQLVEQARASVAANSLNHAVATRMPVKGLGSAAMLNKADVSEKELMESQVRGRFESPSWYQMIAGFSVENLLRESNKMQALGLWMDLKQYERLERMEAILATQLAIEVRRDSEPRLAQAREAAAKAGQ